jgi:hypothetical protein
MTSGVCQFCKVTDDQVDGNKLSWHNGARNCCSRYDCVKKYYAQLKRARQRFQSETRKRTPGEIYELQKQERRDRNRRYREAAKARGLLKEKGGAA